MNSHHIYIYSRPLWGCAGGGGGCKGLWPAINKMQQPGGP